LSADDIRSSARRQSIGKSLFLTIIVSPDLIRAKAAFATRGVEEALARIKSGLT